MQSKNPKYCRTPKNSFGQQRRPKLEAPNTLEEEIFSSCTFTNRSLGSVRVTNKIFQPRFTCPGLLAQITALGFTPPLSKSGC